MEGFDPSGRTDQGHWSSKGITFRRCQGRCGLTVPPSHSLSRNLHRTFFPFFFSSDCHLSSFHFLNPLPNSTQTRHFEFFKIPFGRDHFGMRTSWLVFRDKYTVPLASVANYYFTLSIRESCTNFFCNDRTRKFRKILFLYPHLPALTWRKSQRRRRCLRTLSRETRETSKGLITDFISSCHFAPSENFNRGDATTKCKCDTTTRV